MFIASTIAPEPTPPTEKVMLVRWLQYSEPEIAMFAVSATPVSVKGAALKLAPPSVPVAFPETVY
ncbi:MAG: hypothetical protein ABIS68_04470 [Casimicrobiaceae bacterium]